MSSKKSMVDMVNGTDEGVPVAIKRSPAPSSWIKTTIVASVVLVAAALITAVLHDNDSGRMIPVTDLPIEDVTTSSSPATEVVNRLQTPNAAAVPAAAGSAARAGTAPEPPPQQPGPQQPAADIIEWMTRGGAAFPHLQLVEYGDEYRGVHASGDAAEDAVLADIPEQFIITFATARQSEIGQRVIRALPEYDDLDMSHYLIALFLAVQYDLGPASWWYPYLNTLPKHYRNMPPNFTPEEKEMMKESRLDSLLDDDRFTKDYDEICAAVPEFCAAHTLERYKWARLVLRTRAFSLDKDGVEQTALQPFVDMINHDFDNAASWRYDQERRTGQIYTLRAVKAGEIVTISYGTKSNRVLLSTYGFAIKGNPNHEVPLYVQLPDGEIASGMLARRVAKTGNPNTEFYRILHTITLSTSDDDFRAAMKLCRISVATADELDRYDAFDGPVNLRNEAAALGYLQESIDAALYKYTTTADDDDELLRDGAALSDNQRHIIITRQSDKLTLMKMNDLIEDLLDLVPDSVDQAAFNRRRYHAKYADHQKYVRALVDLRRSMRQ